MSRDMFRRVALSQAAPLAIAASGVPLTASERERPAFVGGHTILTPEARRASVDARYRETGYAGTVTANYIDDDGDDACFTALRPKAGNRNPHHGR